MKATSYILKQASDLLKVCTVCYGMGQLKGYKMAPISVNDFGKTFEEEPADFSHVITRCEECMGTGEKIDWGRWCLFKSNNPWHVVQEVEKIFAGYFHEVPQ